MAKMSIVVFIFALALEARKPPNDLRISRRRAERSEAKPVGWMRVLCRF